MAIPTRHLLLGAALATLAAGALADGGGSTKDIVLDRLRSPLVTLSPAAAPAGDAMAVSVLLEAADGTLTPKGLDSVFRTGDRLRVKLLASREAKVSLYNTNPRGETTPTPIWQGQVRPGQETLSPRLALTGTSGVDQLHVLLEPLPSAQPGGPLAWLTNWLRAGKDGGADSKDIRIDVQNTASASYLFNPQGQGLVSTVRIAHGPQ